MLPVILTAVTLALAVATVRYLWAIAALGIDDGHGADVPTTEQMRAHIHWRSFYVNPQDPRGWVPKSWGGGTTVNFRTLARVRVFIALILGTAFSAVALVASLMSM